MATTRRDFIKTAGLAAGAALAAPAGIAAAPRRAPGMAALDGKTSIPFKLGLASYSFRAFGLDEAVAMTRRLGLEAIALKSVHLALESPPDAVKAAAAKVRDAGLDLYGCGVEIGRAHV